MAQLAQAGSNSTISITACLAQDQQILHLIEDLSDSRTANVRAVSIFYFVAFVFELLLNRSKMSPSC